MQHVTDAIIDELIRPEEVEGVLTEAFKSFGHGQATMQERIRSEAQGIKLSTLGAVIPAQGVAGAKVYTTIQGKFTFVIVLFSTEDGRALATFDAGSITQLRTAACSLIAARHLARPTSRRMALFGAGVQGRAHAVQMSRNFELDEIRVCDPYAAPSLAEELQSQCGRPVRLCNTDETLDGADIIVTASRSPTPLFTGQQLEKGCFVAAIGSSLPHTRELDDAALARASVIAVEWKTQTLREAGDLVLAGPGLVTDQKVIELGALVTGAVPGRRNDEEITLYKSVGVGLEDIALAGLAWSRLQTST